MRSILTSSDAHDFLVRVYFGSAGRADPVKAAVNRAYRDLSRTLRGIAIHPDRKTSTTEAKQILEVALRGLDASLPATQLDFDIWHESLSGQLGGAYPTFDFTVGQAQKWINMAIKYLFILDRAAVDDVWQFCHVPIDNKLLESLAKAGHSPPGLGSHYWSRIPSYADYLRFQKWFRDEFAEIPMDKEFRLWMQPTPS